MRTLNRTGLKTVVAIVIAMTLAASGALIASAQAAEQEVPEITGVTATLLYGDIWSFRGNVGGCATVSGLTITYGGIIEGETTTTNIDGSFDHEVDLNGASGTAGCHATSVDSIDSEEAYTEAG